MKNEALCWMINIMEEEKLETGANSTQKRSIEILDVCRGVHYRYVNRSRRLGACSVTYFTTKFSVAKVASFVYITICMYQCYRVGLNQFWNKNFMHRLIGEYKMFDSTTPFTRHRLRWVYTFDAVKRFDTLSYASQMRAKAFCAVSVYTFHAGISARQRTRKSVARRKMLQSSTALNFSALRQRKQAIQPIIYRCHELSLQRIDVAITSVNSNWLFSWSRRSRKAHVITVKVQSWLRWSNWGFRSCLASPAIQLTLFL